MAFVFKSDRKFDPKGNTDLGPGEYQGPSVLKIKKCSAPFNSTAMKDSGPCRNNMVVNQCGSHFQTPGPGSYQIQNDAMQQKVLVSSVNQEVKIIEVPKPNGVFKSGSKRFKKEAKNVPGPGTYNHSYYTNINKGLEQNDQQMLKEQFNQIKGIESKQQNRLYEIVKQKNTNLVVPSVPSKQHVLGYNEGKNNKLELNQNPFCSSQQEQLGPGQYDLKDTFYQNRKKGKTFGNTKSKREANRNKTSTNKNIGPGSYDTELLQQNSQMHKFKQSRQFMDKTKRLFDQEQFSKSKNKKQKHQKSNGHMSLQGDYDLQDDEQEDEKDNIPGPGAYFVERPDSCFNGKVVDHSNGKYQFFTFGCERFQGERSISTAGCRMGPGKYNVNLNHYSAKSFNTQQVSFNATGLRFNNYQEGYRNNPGPGQYNPKTTLEDVVVSRVQKGLRGKFGVNDKRFQQYNVKEEKPGPGQYLDPNSYVDKLQENFDQKTHFFKSKSQRNTFNQVNQQSNAKTTVPPVGNYQLDYYNMSRKLQKVKQEEHELEIKKPGFYSSQPRFTKLEKEPMIEEDQSKQSVNDIQKKKQNDAQFNVKSKRFKTEHDYRPGPGQYAQQSNDQWSKRTYNILFADI